MVIYILMTAPIPLQATPNQPLQQLVMSFPSHPERMTHEFPFKLLYSCLRAEQVVTLGPVGVAEEEGAGAAEESVGVLLSVG